MRIFAAPTDLWRRLAHGCPDLHDEIARAITVTGLDPEVEIRRDVSTTAPPYWSVVIRAGNYERGLHLDVGVDDAASAAVAIMLVDLVADLRHELPHVFDRPEISRGVEQLVPWPWARPKPGGGSS